MSAMKADVVIIGGGCVGTSAAYHLCKAGITNVIVVERETIGSGASGRCAAGIRQQWSTRGNVMLAMHSVEAFSRFEEEVGCDIEFDQGGYLLPAFNEEMIADFIRNISLQNDCGVNTRLIDRDEIKKIAPLLNTKDMIGAAFGSTDGKANPFLVVKGYADRASAMGARIIPQCTVTGIRIAGNDVCGVDTNKGVIEAEWVINAAGGHAAEIAALAGIDVPVTPYRHQILVSEPIEPCFSPMMIDLHNNFYVQQVQHGSFIMGQTDKEEEPGTNQRETWRFTAEVAQKFTTKFPALRQLKIVRQWAGLYAMTPDSQPVIGRFSEYDSFLIAAGFSGHGFMVSPATGKILSDIISDEARVALDISEYRADRFSGDSHIQEKNVV
jgi:sarcosine oxidase, subunit beta